MHAPSTAHLRHLSPQTLNTFTFTYPQHRSSSTPVIFCADHPEPLLPQTSHIFSSVQVQHCLVKREKKSLFRPALKPIRLIVYFPSILVQHSQLDGASFIPVCNKIVTLIHQSPIIITSQIYTRDLPSHSIKTSKR